MKRLADQARLTGEKDKFMSQNENDFKSEDKDQIANLFQAVNNVSLDPSPYMRTRVLAVLREDQRPFYRVKVWKLFSAVSMFVLVLVSAYAISLMNKIESSGVAREAYVIHVNFSENDLSKVANAEVVLPDGVRFVSKKGLAEGKKMLRLPIDIKSVGRGKLPFVVTANSDGEKQILVRLLDEHNQLVREQVLNFKFARQDNLKTF